MIKKEKQTKERIYDLEERLLNYANNIIKQVEALPNTRSGNHIGNQLLKCGTAPYVIMEKLKQPNQIKILFTR